MPDPTHTLTAANGPPTVSAADAGTTAADRTPDDGVMPFAPPGYDLGEEVGRGGMGVVFRAKDKELNREVAVKILLPKYPPHSATARRFVDEAHITSQLQHPGVPPVYRVGLLPDGRPFLAMKLIKGQTRDALLRGRGGGRPEFGRWLGVFEGICQAVGYAHAHHVLHRDLKPSNVMVGAFGEVQVMDWGLAKLLPSGTWDDGTGVADPEITAATDPTEIKSPRDADLLTQYGSMLGTPAFMAPEQAIGEVDQIDRRTDVFGLGAILCALLTGKPPYVGDSAENNRRLAARAKLDDCVARLDGCGAEPDLAALCKRCLSVEPADRPADAGEVARLVHDLRVAADERARRAE
ncbi:MAG: serine/threonine-protein kinase, partial [Gemmataceae bacterium]